MRSFRDRSAAEPFRFWRAGSREILLDHPIVMGILNLTPDSFSDGGNFLSLDAALDHARMMIEEGADIIDVGGESTRPGATPVSAEDEIARVLPVVKAVSERWPEIPVSIDTTKSRVAAAALEQGADIINDVSAMRLDAEMPIVSARSGAGLVLMHSRGGVADMATYESAIYTDVAGEVLSELGSQILAVEEAGVHTGQVVLIGAPATAPDISLGWIVPERGGVGRTRQVAGFVEKPSSEEAAAYVRRGALRNTLILAGNVRALLRVYALEMLEPLSTGDIPDDVLHTTISGLAAVYAQVPGMDLSRDILQPSSRWLRVLPLPECGWTDIGTLERLEAWWRSHPRSLAEVREFGVLPIAGASGSSTRAAARPGARRTGGNARTALRL